MNELKDSVYEDFISILTVQNIKQFYYECKKKHIDIKSNKKSASDSSSTISKEAFNNIMQNVFGKEFKKDESSINIHYYSLKKEDARDKSFSILCEMLFNRFKTIRCEVKIEKNKILNENYYYINDFYSDQHEIDTYEFACALCIFPKIEFKEKIKLLFDITDVDEDGYINESEIKNMIFAVNFIFCDEDSTLRSNSSIINQSLSTIKSQLLFNMIVKYPGELYKVMSTEKYVDFDQLYNAVTKIDNYKYTVIPTFINIKNCLLIKKVEPEFEMERKNLNEFLSITSEIVSNVKKTNCEIVKDSKDLKKLIDTKGESNMESMTKKKRNYVDENKKKIISKKNLNNNNNSNKNSIETEMLLDKTSSNTNLPIINPRTSHARDKNYIFSQKFHANNSNLNHLLFFHDNYNVNYNRILNLEAQPGRIKVKDPGIIIPSIRENLLSINKTESSTMEREATKNYKSTNSKVLHITHKDFPEKKNTFISYNEIMNEVQVLSNKNHNANNEDTEEILKYIKEVQFTGTNLKNKFKDSGTSSSIVFGNFKYK